MSAVLKMQPELPPAERVPPHSNEAEQSVLGGLLLDNGAWDRVGDLTGSDFFRYEHGLIYVAIGALANAGQPADVITVHEHLNALGKASECGGMAYLNELAQSVPSASSVRYYASIVVSHAVTRTTMAALSNPMGRSVEQIIEAGARRLAAASTPPATEVPVWVSKLQSWTPPTDLLTREVNVDWAVTGLIQAGKVGALVAAGGTGKTTLLMILGISIALGRPFFGSPVKSGSFVLLSADDPQSDLDVALARVARALGLTVIEAETVSAKFRVVSVQEFAHTTFTYTERGDVRDTDLGEYIAQAVAGIDDLVGISLDTLRQFSGGSSNDEQVVKLMVAACTRLANSTGAFVVLPHHTGKQNYRDGVSDMYAGSGSAAIADNCRFVLLLMTTTWSDIEQKVQRTGREQGDPLVLLSTRGSLLVKPPEPLFLHRDGYMVGRIAGRSLSKDQQLDKRDRDILAAVRTGAQSKNEISAAVTGKKATLNSTVDDLVRRGLLAFDASSGSRGGSQKLIVSAAGGKVLDAPTV